MTNIYADVSHHVYVLLLACMHTSEQEQLNSIPFQINEPWFQRGTRNRNFSPSNDSKWEQYLLIFLKYFFVFIQFICDNDKVIYCYYTCITSIFQTSVTKTSLLNITYLSVKKGSNKQFIFKRNERETMEKIRYTSDTKQRILIQKESEHKISFCRLVIKVLLKFNKFIVFVISCTFQQSWSLSTQ